jgi:hypothetical protein
VLVTPCVNTSPWYQCLSLTTLYVTESLVPMFNVRTLSLLVAILLTISGISAKPTESVKPDVAKPGTKVLLDTKAEKPADTTPAITVTSIDLVRQPDVYLNKKVTFKATFNSFASLGLDYKKAFRDSKDFVSMLVLRPDVSPKYRIPLSELKLFFPRKKSDVVLHLDAGDTIQVTGQVFSTALGEPWMDVDLLTIVEKTAKTDLHTADTKKPEKPVSP